MIATATTMPNASTLSPATGTPDAGLRAAGELPSEHEAARRAMLDSQLRPSGVSEPIVLERMGTVAREAFVPPAMAAAAYSDRAVPLGEGRYLAAPLFHGLLLQEARLVPSDTVCIVSADGRYLAALVEPLVANVRVLSPAEVLAGEAGGEPASLLLIDGAAESFPPALAALVREDGRVVGGMLEDGVARLAAGERLGDTLTLLPIIEMGIPRLPQFDKPRTWRF